MSRVKSWLGVILFCLGILLAEASGNTLYATNITKKTFVCAYYGKVFTDRATVSTNTFGGQDSEFRSYAVGIQPLQYFIHTCPACGSPDILTLLPQARYRLDTGLPLQERIEIGNYLDSFREINKADPASFSASQKYEVLANLYAMRGMSSIQTAEVYLNAAWMADDEGNSDKNKLYRTKSIDYLVTALKNLEVKGKQAQIITYLTGELYRRLEKFDEALTWFSRVETDDSFLLRLCKQQKELAAKKDPHKSMMPAVTGMVGTSWSPDPEKSP